jgi:Domain of unknown function (DUF4129)
MKFGRFALPLALACLFYFDPPMASDAAAPALDRQNAAAQSDASAMRIAAEALDRAAAHRKAPPSTVGPGLPPALRVWLHAGLADARTEKNDVTRAAELRALAASLRMGAALAERRSGAPPAHLTADVRQVLTEPAFRANVSAAPPQKREQSWLGRALQAIAKWWASVMFRVIGAAAGTPVIGNIFAIILITAAAAALAFLVFRIALLIAARRAREPELNLDGMPLTALASADETYDHARAAARSGSYGLAIALLFQAALLALDRSGRVPYDSARTAGEYRRAVRRSVAAAAASFETLARAFTYVAYAQAPAGESDWRAADAAYMSMNVAAADRP